MNFKGFLIFLFLFFLNVLPASEEMLLQKGAPLFRDPDKMDLAFTVEKEMPAIVLEKKKTDIANQNYLVIHTSIWKIFVPDKGVFWTFPEIESVYKEKLKQHSFRFARLSSLMFSGILLIFAGVFSAFFFFRDKTFRFRNFLLPLSVVFFHCGICLYAIGFSGGVFIKPSDEIYYFKIAQKLLAFDFSTAFQYTIGHSFFFYSPIVFFTGAAKYEDVIVWAMALNCFLVMPICLLILFAVLKKLFRSETLPFYSLLLWFGFVLLYHQRLFAGKINIGSTYVQKAVPSLPVFGFNTSLYEWYIAFGWNGMSDALCMLFLFLTLLSAILLKPSTKNLILVSVLFAFTCLIRVNSIFYAPLLGFILYLNYSGLLKTPRNWEHFIKTGAIAFLAVFSIQLLVNFYQFGSPFTWPYILHTANDAGKVFLPELVPYGLSFLSASNHAIFVIGTLSLFFIPDRKMRAVLALWIYPALFFFTGYPVVYNNFSRFILPVYPAFMAAIFLNGVWKTSWSSVLRTLGILLAGVLLTAPCDSPALRRFLPWSLEWHGVRPETMDVLRWIVIGLSVVVLATFAADVFRARKEKLPLRAVLIPPLFLGLFLIFFYAGNFWLTGFAMLCAFLYGLYDAVFLCIQAVRKPCETAAVLEDRPVS